jgi:hypothetical protein
MPFEKEFLTDYKKRKTPIQIYELGFSMNKPLVN